MGRELVDGVHAGMRHLRSNANLQARRKVGVVSI